jgi:aspartate carbamoyltransferase catalytic subunit
LSRSLIAIRHLDPNTIRDLLELAQAFRSKIRNGELLPSHADKTVGLLFFENSTRTRVSFEQAAALLGCKISAFTSAGSSMTKGETLKDTIMTLSRERINCMVIRHKASGAPGFAQPYLQGPIVNAGDGQHEHPTQALGDALTILDRKGKIKGLRVAIVGDVLHSRVARSNAWLLDKLGAEVRLVGPRNLMPRYPGLLPGKVGNRLEEGIEGADVVMCLRLQNERMSEGAIGSVREFASSYQINEDSLRYAHPDCVVMHPGPINRGVEIDDATADGPRSMILDQVENSVFVRTAVLHYSFGGGSL